MKIIKKSNPRVVVQPLLDYILEEVTQEESYDILRSRCIDISKAIKGIYENVDVEIIHDEKEVCSFCGKEWRISILGRPACCQEAFDEFLESNKSVK